MNVSSKERIELRNATARAIEFRQQYFSQTTAIRAITCDNLPGLDEAIDAAATDLADPVAAAEKIVTSILSNKLGHTRKESTKRGPRRRKAG